MSTPPCSTRPTRVLRGRLMALCLAGCLSGAAQAEVYRCGSTYQDSPCPGGRTVDADDARSPQERAAALERHRAERAQANQLRAERHAQERRQPTATAPAGIAVRQPDDLDALPSDHPCATTPGRHAGQAKARIQCLNGLPVYKAKASPPAR